MCTPDFYKFSYLPILLFELNIYAMIGRSVEIDNTDAEGRLILSGTSHSIQERT